MLKAADTILASSPYLCASLAASARYCLPCPRLDDSDQTVRTSAEDKIMFRIAECKCPRTYKMQNERVKVDITYWPGYDRVLIDAKHEAGGILNVRPSENTDYDMQL